MAIPLWRKIKTTKKLNRILQRETVCNQAKRALLTKQNVITKFGIRNFFYQICPFFHHEVHLLTHPHHHWSLELTADADSPKITSNDIFAGDGRFLKQYMFIVWSYLFIIIYNVSDFSFLFL